MANFSLEAIVLSRRDLGEADRLVSFFSRTLGKQKAVAKGVRRLTSRMAGHLEPGRLVKIFLIETKGLALITQAETKELYVGTGASVGESSPGRQLSKLKALFKILEATSRLFDEHQGDSRAFDDLAKILKKIKRAPMGQIDLLVNTYVLNLLARQGYRPELYNCLGCQQAVAEGEDLENIFFSSSRGGLVHKKCGLPGPGNFVLNSESLTLLRRMGDLENNSVYVHPYQKATLSQIGALVTAFYEWNVDKYYKSAHITDKMITK